MAVFIVRHAVAKGRHGWSGDDLLRPLTSRGRRQAEAIALRLADHPIARIASSPAVRCRQTVTPLADRLGGKVLDAHELLEGEGGRRALALLVELADGDGDSVLCTHGDLVPLLLDRLATGHGLALDADPAFAKGSIWHLGWVDGKVTSATYLPAPT